MTLEFVYYLMLAFIGLFFCIGRMRSEQLYSLFTLFLFTGFSIITRYSGFDVDMKTYAGALEVETFNIYFLKEPVYWITSRYVYKLTNSAELTFIVYDILSFILIIKARKNCKLPQYFPFLLLLFFPSIMGINNVFRQYLSFCFFVYMISLFFVESKFIKKCFFAVIAVLTHNVSALFTPIIFLINRKKRISFRGIMMGLSVILLLPIALSTKSSTDTGTLGVEVYLVVLLAIIAFIVISYRYTLNGIAAKFFYMLLYMLSLTSVSAVLMGSAQSKRIGMYTLIISLIPLTICIESNYKQKILVRVLVYITLMLPTILFSSSLQFLLTN